MVRIIIVLGDNSLESVKEVHFSHPAWNCGEMIRSIRAGASRLGETSFKLSPALLRLLGFFISCIENRRFILGGSSAVSIMRAMTEGPDWVNSIFGSDKKGNSLLNRELRRSYSGSHISLARPDEFVIELKVEGARDDLLLPRYIIDGMLAEFERAFFADIFNDQLYTARIRQMLDAESFQRQSAEYRNKIAYLLTTKTRPIPSEGLHDITTEVTVAVPDAAFAGMALIDALRRKNFPVNMRRYTHSPTIKRAVGRGKFNAMILSEAQLAELSSQRSEFIPIMLMPSISHYIKTAVPTQKLDGFRVGLWKGTSNEVLMEELFRKRIVNRSRVSLENAGLFDYAPLMKSGMDAAFVTCFPFNFLTPHPILKLPRACAETDNVLLIHESLLPAAGALISALHTAWRELLVCENGRLNAVCSSSERINDFIRSYDETISIH